MHIFENIHGFIWKSTAANNCNTYLIDGPTRILIDPGHSGLFEHVKRGLHELGLSPDDIGLVICTHGHPDHREASALFKETRALTALHLDEWRFLKSLGQKAAALRGSISRSSAPDIFLKEGDLSIEGYDLKVLHTPGHSPGSVSLYQPDRKLLFTGDVVFKGGLGRTDLPGGNGKLLKKSIGRLAELDVEWLLPGHGEFIGGEKEVKVNFEQIERVWFSYI